MANMLTYWKVPPNVTTGSTYLMRLDVDEMARRLDRDLTSGEADEIARALLDYMTYEPDVLDHIRENYLD